VPCTGYPTPGVVNAKTGEVLLADAYDEMSQDKNGGYFQGWISKC